MSQDDGSTLLMGKVYCSPFIPEIDSHTFKKSSLTEVFLHAILEFLEGLYAYLITKLTG